MDIVYHREDEKVKETFEKYNVDLIDKKKIESLMNLLDDITFNESHELFDIYQNMNKEMTKEDFQRIYQIQEKIGINAIWDKLNTLLEKYPKELKHELFLA